MALVVGSLLAFTVGLMAFCLGYDVTAAAYLAWLLKSGRIRAFRV